MEKSLQEERPIYLQIADRIEEGILSGAFVEGEQIPSITDFSVQYKINPATALKGITLLVNDSVLYKKRGVGMFVAEGAKERLQEKRRSEFYEKYIQQLVNESQRLQLSQEDVINMIRRGFAR